MEVLRVLFEANGGPHIEFVPVEAGAHCAAKYGASLTDEALRTILDLGVAFKAPTKTTDVISVGLTLRHRLKAYASVNELRSYPGVPTALKPNIDVVLVRDNSEGLFKMHSVYPSPDTTIDLRIISREAARRIARVGFELARKRRKKLAVCAFTSSINSDLVFIKGCEEIAQNYADVEFSVRKVDAFAGTAVSDPEQYDVVVAPNEWGSIMTDLFAAACGSVGLAARGNLGDATAYFEPIHGTAPGKAGKGTVNPVSQIMAGKLLLEWLGKRFADPLAADAASCLQQAVQRVLVTGKVLTVDLGGAARTAEMVASIAAEIRELCKTTK